MFRQPGLTLTSKSREKRLLAAIEGSTVVVRGRFDPIRSLTKFAAVGEEFNLTYEQLVGLGLSDWLPEQSKRVVREELDRIKLIKPKDQKGEVERGGAKFVATLGPLIEDKFFQKGTGTVRGKAGWTRGEHLTGKGGVQASSWSDPEKTPVSYGPGTPLKRVRESEEKRYGTTARTLLPELQIAPVAAVEEEGEDNENSSLPEGDVVESEAVPPPGEQMWRMFVWAVCKRHHSSRETQKLTVEIGALEREGGESLSAFARRVQIEGEYMPMARWFDDMDRTTEWRDRMKVEGKEVSKEALSAAVEASMTYDERIEFLKACREGRRADSDNVARYERLGGRRGRVASSSSTNGTSATTTILST